MPFDQGLVLKRHPVQYFRCEKCSFVQTEEPYWLDEAYAEAVSALDVGAVSRNLRLAPIAQALIKRLFNPSGQFIDYGGGTGLFVRLMRDAGFDFFWFDKFAQNVFARGFEAVSGKFELLTAFEVFEHLVQPVTELERMLAYSRNILFTTVLLPAEAPRPGHWWYYGLEHGQHVSLYTRQALQALADRFHLRLCSSGELHLLTEKQISQAQFRFNTRRRIVSCVNWLTERRSLVEADYQMLVHRAPRSDPGH